MTQSAYGTGEINFACALMACGIPLDVRNPCTIVAHQNGQVYSRYHFEATSCDGTYRTGDLSNMWSNIAVAPTSHPIRIISDFIKSASDNMRLADWFEHAIDTFSIQHVKDFDTAYLHIKTYPENSESYCLAWVLNRRELLTLHHNANKETFMTNGVSSALIGVNMPKIQKQEIINRMNG